MNLTITPRPLRHLLAASRLALLLAHPAARAAPGAHGPNGEHLDSPAATRTASALPRVEAKSEAFELVAELRDGALVILVDRYATPTSRCWARNSRWRVARSRPWPPSVPSRATTRS
jgi:hypothetical protein